MNTAMMPRRPGFTMLELMIVAALFVLLLAIAVPAFSGMLRSTEQTMAENAMNVGIAAARDAAVRGSRGEDTAAVFFYEPGVGYTIVSYMSAGIVNDERPDNTPVRREIFVPMPGYEPVQLPNGWMIRGFAPAFSIDDEWYGNLPPYDNQSVRQQGNWVFPETGFYFRQDEPGGDVDANHGWKRRTFMLRFEGGTGLFKTAEVESVLLLSPVPTFSFRNAGLFGDQRWRADREPDGRRFVRRVAATPDLNAVQKRALLGFEATDTVLAKPVSAVALYPERDLAARLGVRVDRRTDSIYTRFDRPEWFSTGNAQEMTRRLNEWIEDRGPGPLYAPIDSKSRIFTVHRYLGTLQEATGTIHAGGAS